MNKQDKYELMAALLARFDNKRWLLSKFLVDNDAISENFLKSLNTEYLSEEPPLFHDLTQLNDYLNRLIDKQCAIKSVDLEKKLIELLEEEKYEEAAKLRDWIKKTKKEK